MALGQGADHVDKIPDPVRVDRQHDAEGRSEPRRPTTTSSTVSANGAQRAAAADEDLSLRPPLDALPIIRPLTLLRIRGQAVHGGGSGTVRSSSDTAAASADQGNEDNVPSSSSSGSSEESSICSSSGADVDPSVTDFAVTRDKSGRCECMDRMQVNNKAFVKLMKKVMKWKIQRNIKASSSSYCGQKLLKFSNSCKKMKPVIVFLRSVAAIWICSHREHYEHLIPELEEGHGLEDWCFLHVIPCHEWADHVQMIAVGTALEVSIRVINLNKGPAQDVYTHQGVPRVDVLFTGNHYDVIYPRQLSDKSVPLPEAANTLQSKSHGEVEAVSQPSAANDLHIQSLPGIADAASLLIRSVWSHNCEEELDALLSVVRHGNVTIAIDMEFASTAGKQKNPETTAEWYSNIHALVNGGDILQFGLAIFLDSSSTQAEHVCEINLKFDVNSCSYNEGTIKFLEKAKYNLESHNINGVLPARLAKWVLHEFDRLYDREITWVVFQGDADIGFLLKLLGNVMPETRLEYLQRHNCSLPHLYDVRVLARILFGGYVKGLSSVAASLKVKRFGKEHSSGSDALLTLDCFLELKKRLGSGKVHQYRGVMAGIFMVDRIVNEALPMGHENVHVVEVWDHNLQEEVQLIVQAVQNNYCIVGVDGCFVPALHPMPFHKDQQACLNHIIEALKAVCSYEISVALVSYTGQIPQGKWWRFHVSEYSYPYCSMPGAPRHVHFLKFADMLKSCGLLGNPKITWGAFEGAEVFASLYHMVQRGTKADFPLHALQYRRRRSLMFPFLRDVRLLVSPEKATSLVEIAQELGLSVPHKQSEWKAMLIAQLLAQFRDMLGYSDTILKAYADHNGHLLSKCCSHSGFYC